MKKRWTFLVAILVAFLVMPTITVSAENKVDKWEVIVIMNFIPFTPEGYSGTLVPYKEYYTGKDGVKTLKTYKNVAFVLPEDITDYKQEGVGVHGESIKIDGKNVYGMILGKIEYLFFLEHITDSKEERFYLDIELPELTDTYEAFDILAQNEEKVLIAVGSTIFTYQFDTQTCSVITESALDYKLPVEDKLYYNDWDHQEYECDWLESNEGNKTGNQVIAYWVDNFNLEVDTSFQEEFLKIQQDRKKDTDKEDTSEYEIYSRGQIYRIADDKYMGNIHLPYPICGPYASQLHMIAEEACWLVENNILALYRFGDVVRKYELPDGNWSIIESDLSIHKDANTGKYVIDTNEDGTITAKELDASITNVNLLLFNSAEHSVYTINNNGVITELLKDVYDYCEVRGWLYWMDNERNAYEIQWMKTTESVLIGIDVVGISKCHDERSGYIVKPGDSRGENSYNGFYICSDKSPINK